MGGIQLERDQRSTIIHSFVVDLLLSIKSSYLPNGWIEMEGRRRRRGRGGGGGGEEKERTMYSGVKQRGRVSIEKTRKRRRK